MQHTVQNKETPQLSALARTCLEGNITPDHLKIMAQSMLRAADELAAFQKEAAHA